MEESANGIGGVFQERLIEIREMAENAAKSSTTRQILEELSPLVREIKHYNDDLENPKEEIQKLVSEMEAGGKVINRLTKCSKIRCWNPSSLPVSCHMLLGQRSILSCMNVNTKTQRARDMEETLSQVRDNLVRLIKENINLGQRNFSTQMKAPEKPEFTVGLEWHLTRLKVELLKDGTSILGLTGPGGSGKTTLAKNICWDEQVRGKFRENILFVTFSKTPNFKIIVQTLFQHTGYSVPEFQSNEDAVTWLEVLLKHIGETTPILMVLDDVWPGSECLVNKFRVNLPDYKILVTSRVVFPKTDVQIRMDPLRHDDAVALFRHLALLKDDNSSYISEEYLVEEVVRGCKGSPLALKIVGRSLCQQPFEVWQKMVKEWSKSHSIFYSNADLLDCLQKSLDVLEDEPIISDCFMDLGLFPEDQRIPVAALVDMWAELYKLDNKGIDAMAIINKLATRNLANVIVTRKVACDADNYYNNHFIMQHDLLRELAIYQISQEPFKLRKRVIIDTNGLNSQWCVTEKQQGTIARILSSFPKCYVTQKQHNIFARPLSLLPKWCVTQGRVISCLLKLLPAKWCFEPKRQQVTARTLSISTDEMFTSDFDNIQTAEAEVLILNLRTTQYFLPEFTKKMSKLKVLIVTNYGIHPSELKKFEILSSLSNLKRIRLEKISVPFLCKLTYVQKLSLYMCNIMKAFNSSITRISDALPNLLEIDIDYCNDLVELPAGFCDITTLKRLSITNCHKLFALPSDIGKLENLEVLRLSSCTDLTELPDSIKRLSKLSFLDISDCISFSQLPEHIGELRNLKRLCIRGCSRLSELPSSVMDLTNLEAAICDRETAVLLEDFEPMLPNLRIEIPEADINLNWLRGDCF